jgi:hypothetical protein
MKGSLFLPIFLFWLSRVSKLNCVGLLSFGLITAILIIASPVCSKKGIEKLTVYIVLVV